jgi:hypothetical protein
MQVAMALWFWKKTHNQYALDSNNTLWSLFFLNNSLGSKHGKKISPPAWDCCICCNPLNGRVEFKDVWLTNSSVATEDEREACQLSKTRVRKEKLLDLAATFF